MDFHCGCDLYLSFANKLLEQGKFVKILTISFDFFLLKLFFQSRRQLNLYILKVEVSGLYRTIVVTESRMSVQPS